MTQRHLFAATTFVAACVAGEQTAWAQFVEGNEAVRRGPDGRVTVELPQGPGRAGAGGHRPCHVADHCHAGAWLMVETADGLRECTDAYARPGTCRASTYGSRKLLRLWVVKRGGVWRQCQRPDVDSRCVDMFARPPANLPYPALQ